VNNTDARLWHPWLRINRVLRVMLHTRWSTEAWSQVRVEFRRALALRSDPARGGGSEGGVGGSEEGQLNRARGLLSLLVPDLMTKDVQVNVPPIQSRHFQQQLLQR
jgi:hypothetical protein